MKFDNDMIWAYKNATTIKIGPIEIHVSVGVPRGQPSKALIIIRHQGDSSPPENALFHVKMLPLNTGYLGCFMITPDLYNEVLLLGCRLVGIPRAEVDEDAFLDKFAADMAKLVIKKKCPINVTSQREFDGGGVWH